MWISFEQPHCDRNQESKLLDFSSVMGMTNDAILSPD